MFTLYRVKSCKGKLNYIFFFPLGSWINLLRFTSCVHHHGTIHKVELLFQAAAMLAKLVNACLKIFGSLIHVGICEGLARGVVETSVCSTAKKINKRVFQRLFVLIYQWVSS